MSPRSWRALLRTYAAFAWAFASLLVFTPVALALVPIRRRAHDFFSIVWARGALAFAGVRVELEGDLSFDPAERFLVVANHQSVLDIPALVLVLQPRTSIRFVAKLANFRLPMIGWTLRAFDHVGVDPKSARRSIDGLHEAETALAARASLVVFPEGTRTSDGRVAPFRASFFRVAQRARVRILPVTISGAYEAFPRGAKAVRLGVPIRIRVHAPLPPPGDERDAVQRAAETSREIIAAALRLPDDGSAAALGGARDSARGIEAERSAAEPGEQERAPEHR